MSDPILTQKIQDLLGKLSIMESLLPQIKDLKVRTAFEAELSQVKLLIKRLQS